MKKRDFDLGDGTVHVLTAGEDPGALRASLRSVVPRRLVETWADVPATFTAWASA